MPTLHWIGKEKVTNHHLDIPYHTLDLQYQFGNKQGADDTKPTNLGSDNLIIHADNLLALKSLLPQYEGRVKCIYIDPPYNTGNEGWVYNDNVSSPRFKKWLGQVVGKEGEDLTRHDKWLCMMYPRLKLLHKLLADDGLMIIHIDENEYHNLLSLIEEVFGKKNNLGTIIWDKKNPKGLANKISYQHESIVVFSKDAEQVKDKLIRKKKNARKILDYARKVFSKIGKASYPEDILQVCKKYKLDKELFNEYKFIYNLEKVNKEFSDWLKGQDFSGGEKAYKFIDENGEVFQTVSMAAPDKPETRSHRPLKHPITGKNCPVPQKGWRFPDNAMDDILNLNQIIFGQDETTQPRRKYLLKENMYESINSIVGFGGSDDDFQKTIGIKFENPKPQVFATEIIEWFSESDSIILDSFAGSGTTAHAVLNLNKQDGGNRKFILIEMEDYAETITAERVKRVINGYGKDTPSEGTGGSFSFYTLGERVLDDEQSLNPNLALLKIHGYIWYSETHTAYIQQATAAGYLGKYNNTGIYFHYQPHQVTVLDDAYLMNVTELCEQYIMYADICLLPETLMHKHNIIFKKIPRDISKL